MNVQDRIRNIFIKVWVWIVGIVLWVIITELTTVRPIILPPIQMVLQAYWDLRLSLLRSLGISLFLIAAGFLLGTAVGVLISLLMAYSKFIRDSIGSLSDFLRPAPVFALIPLFVLWFGVGRIPQILLIMVGVMVIIGVTT